MSECLTWIQKQQKLNNPNNLTGKRTLALEKFKMNDMKRVNTSIGGGGLVAMWWVMDEL